MNLMPMKYANLFPHLKISTAKEYQDAIIEEDNPAGNYIDAGLEPYVMDEDAYDLGLHSFVEVWDVTFPKYGLKLTTQYGEVDASPDTMIVWK
jgi:hypothetical protein